MLGWKLRDHVTDLCSDILVTQVLGWHVAWHLMRLRFQRAIARRSHAPGDLEQPHRHRQLPHVVLSDRAMRIEKHLCSEFLGRHFECHSSTEEPVHAGEVSVEEVSPRVRVASPQGIRREPSMHFVLEPGDNVSEHGASIQSSNSDVLTLPIRARGRTPGERFRFASVAGRARGF
jgi:hypothetical protein